MPEPDTPPGRRDFFADLFGRRCYRTLNATELRSRRRALPTNPGQQDEPGVFSRRWKIAGIAAAPAVRRDTFNVDAVNFNVDGVNIAPPRGRQTLARPIFTDFWPHAAMLLRGMAFRAAVRYFSTGRPPQKQYSFLLVS